tara:strand:- start:240535 stop:240879 length:345 start_codon:yes stop_codon:yes gene_type:complete
MAESKTTALKVHLKNRDALYKSYMSFLQNGGVFIPSNKKFHLNDKVLLELRLLDELDVFEINCSIAWITPTSAQGRFKVGIGVMFDAEEGKSARNKIETLLAGSIESDKETNTM